VHWVDLLFGIEAVLIILIMVRLARPKRRAQVFSLEKRSRVNQDREQRAA
jgi:hypothetical protein